jgi:1-acyl-sn-glycerol-3-phosphate acyltransferase
VTQVDARMAGQSLASKGLYQLVRTLVEVICRVWNRVTVDGKEHLPRTGPYILAPVHRSNIDTPYASVVSPRRRLRFMGKDSLWKHRWAAWFLSAVGGFPVTRGTADREALERCLDVLAHGEPLVVFPEGTRQHGPLITPLFEGAAWLSVKTGAPIVPLGIGGSERVQPKGSKMVWPRKVHLIVGEPMYPPAGLTGKAARQASKQMTAELHEELQRLFDLARLRARA